MGKNIQDERDAFLNEKDIFESDDNAPDCYELSALFFVYRFLFMEEYDELCNISENIKS